jgi:hypothetical protein
MAVTISVRQVDENNDPIWGSGSSNYITDLQAVAQIMETTLRFLLGEWWEDLSLGFPLFQRLIGSSGSQRNQADVLLIIQQTILACPYVLSITTFTFTNNSAGRASTFTCVCETSFGTLTVTNAPGTSAAVN